MGRVAAGRASGVKLLFQIIQMRYVDKSIPDRSRPGNQQPPQVSHCREPVEIILLLGLVKTREKERKAREEAARTVNGETHTHKVSTLNIITMTGKRKDLEDMMKRRNINILCLKEIKWKGSKARNIGGSANYFTTELMEEKMRDSDEGGAG